MANREDIINGLQATVDRFPEYNAQGVPVARGNIIKPAIPTPPKEIFPDVNTNPLRVNATTGGVPVPKAPKPVMRNPNYISPHVRGEDRKWLKAFLEE
jgi:hypothetical protein